MRSPSFSGRISHNNKPDAELTGEIRGGLVALLEEPHSLQLV